MRWHLVLNITKRPSVIKFVAGVIHGLKITSANFLVFTIHSRSIPHTFLISTAYICSGSACCVLIECSFDAVNAATEQTGFLVGINKKASGRSDGNTLSQMNTSHLVEIHCMDSVLIAPNQRVIASKIE